MDGRGDSDRNPSPSPTHPWMDGWMGTGRRRRQRRIRTHLLSVGRGPRRRRTPLLPRPPRRPSPASPPSPTVAPVMLLLLQVDENEPSLLLLLLQDGREENRLYIQEGIHHSSIFSAAVGRSFAVLQYPGGWCWRT